MVEPTKLPVKTEESSVAAPQFWRPFQSLRREIDHLFAVDTMDNASALPTCPRRAGLDRPI